MLSLFGLICFDLEQEPNLYNPFPEAILSFCIELRVVSFTWDLVLSFCLILIRTKAY